MPRYELSLITRTLTRDGLAGILRRTCNSIMQKGGTVFKLENLGEQELPKRMRAHGDWHTHGRYLLVDFFVGPGELPMLSKEISFEEGVIRQSLMKMESTFGEEKKPLDLLYCWKSYKPPPS